MASAINNGTFVFNPEELKDWSRVINELTFANPTLNELHLVEQGIKSKQQIVFAGRIEQLGKKIAANCVPNEINGITLTDKFWDPVLEDFRLKHCTSDVNQQNKLVNQMTRVNPDYFTITEGSQSQIGNFLVAAVLDAFDQIILEKAWFDDKDGDTFDAVPAGVFTNGTDVAYYTGFDGLFKQIFTSISGSANTNRFTSIAKNAGVSYAAQELVSGEALSTFKSVFTKADGRLRANANAKFYATQSIWDGLVNDLEDTQNSGGVTIITEDGKQTLRYRGIEVVQMSVWDRFIDTYQNNGTVRFRPHRLVLSTPDNLRIGTLSDGDFGDVNAFYDQYNRVNVIDGAYSLDAKFMEVYLASVAY